MTPEARMRAIFEALGHDDMETLISHWAEDGHYFNPMIGPPAEGKANVYATIDRLSKTLQERGEKLIIDRFTYGAGTTPQRGYVEWHIETDNGEGIRQGKLGLHVVAFNDEGFLNRVTVFSHP